MSNIKINLSIVIPHYNTPHLLEKLIKSIKYREDIQIIVVDDNSDRDTDILEIVKNKYRNKVEFYKNDTLVKGAGVCRNIGLNHAVGRWILFADADDYFLENMYEIVAQYFESDFDLVCFVPTSINIDTEQESHRHEIYANLVQDYIINPTRNNLLRMKSSPGNPPWSKLIRHNLIVQNNIKFSEILYSNDIMFMAKVGVNSRKVEASNKSIYCVTRRKGSLTTNMREEVFDIRMQEYIRVCNYLKGQYSKEDVRAMRLTGAGHLYRALSQHYGIKKCFYVMKEFKKNGIPLITIQTFIPRYLVKVLTVNSRARKMDKNYLVS